MIYTWNSPPNLWLSRTCRHLRPSSSVSRSHCHRHSNYYWSGRVWVSPVTVTAMARFQTEAEFHVVSLPHHPSSTDCQGPRVALNPRGALHQHHDQHHQGLHYELNYQDLDMAEGNQLGLLNVFIQLQCRTGLYTKHVIQFYVVTEKWH